MPEGSEEILVVDTGAANLASMVAAWRHIGLHPQVTSDPALVEAAARVVVPGVGAFATGMESLHRNGLDQVLKQRAQDDRPILGVCLGLQLWCRSSDESPGVAGLGHIDHQVAELVDAPTLPHMGWNAITTTPSETGLVEPGYAYFANSFALQEPPKGYIATVVEHGATFVASIERGNFLACQFHPELSGHWGAALMQRWYAATAREPS